MILNDADCETLQQVFPAVFRQRAEDHPLRIAQRRLTYAMDDDRDEDRLLDDMIAAEAIFFGKAASTTEIKFQFALRAAYFLAPTDSRLRSRIFDDMRTAYDVRSAIVHGTMPKESKHRIGGSAVPIPQFVEAVEDYIRLALRKMLLADAFPPNWTQIVLGADP